MRKISMILSSAILVAAGSMAHAEGSGVAAGATTGAVGGAIVGGPVGAVVGGVGGAIVGGISEATQPKFREYVVQERRPSYSYRQDLRVGAELPSEGVTYYRVPNEYGSTNYRYTIVNDRTVLVDPRTHRVVQIID